MPTLSRHIVSWLASLLTWPIAPSRTISTASNGCAVGLPACAVQLRCLKRSHLHRILQGRKDKRLLQCPGQVRMSSRPEHRMCNFLGFSDVQSRTCLPRRQARAFCRNVEAGRGADPCFLWEGSQPGDEAQMTYQEVLEEACRLVRCSPSSSSMHLLWTH